MKLYFMSPLMDHAGKIMKAGNDPENKEKEAILGEIAVDALISDTQEDANCSGSKKLHRWNLARRIQKSIQEVYEGAELSYIDLPVEDISLIKERIAKRYATAVVGPAYIAIEQSED